MLAEQAAGFPEPSGPQLPARGRPPIYADWFKKHRSLDGPDIKNLEDFSSSFTSWYWSLQPKARGGAGRGKLPVPADAWSTIRKRGRNGTYLILVGLLWIGRAIFDGGAVELKQNWEDLVQDLDWVLKSSDPALAAQGSSDSMVKRKAGSAVIVDSRKCARRR